MEMKSYFVINSEAMAEEFIVNNSDREVNILSLSPSASIILRQQVPVLDFHELIQDFDLRNLVLKSMHETHRMCRKIDDDLGGELCNRLALEKIALFQPAYAYSRMWIYYYRELVRYGLAQWFKNTTRGKLVIYKLHQSSSSWHSFFSLAEILKEYAKERGFLVEEVLATPSRVPHVIPEIFSHIRQLFNTGGCKKACKGFLRKGREWFPARVKSMVLKRELRHKSSTLLLSGCLSSPLSEVIASSRMICNDEGLFRWFYTRQHDKKRMIEKACRSLIESYEVSEGFSDQYIFQDFKVHYSQYLLPLVCFEDFRQQYQVASVAWSIPLVFQPAYNILVEYALSKGMPVIGCQHGGSYVSQVVESHFDTDFRRCTHYLSYGFGMEEWHSTYPDVFCPFKLWRFGKVPLAIPQNRCFVDIAFPISIPSPELAGKQELIINVLIRRSDLNIILKPFPGYDEYSFPFSKHVSEASHLKVIDPTWKNFLLAYSPRLVIFELPTTTLDETLHLDVDIFLLIHHVIPLSFMAEKALKKRVRIFDHVEDLVDAILKYDAQKEPKLRDSEYYLRYVQGQDGRVPNNWLSS